MAKFSLKIDPTFKAKVGLHVPGQGEVPVQFEFKGRSRSELVDLSKEIAEAAAESDGADSEDAVKLTIERETQLVMSVAIGWELDDNFDEENIGRLLQKCPNAGNAIFKKYIEEMTPARLGN